MSACGAKRTFGCDPASGATGTIRAGISSSDRLIATQLTVSLLDQLKVNA